MQLPTKNSKQKRTVKNALVNIENVTIQPGFNYRNWIALTQIKLKEREIELVKIRLQSVSDSISTSLLQFTSEISQIVQFEPQVHIPINDMEYSNYKAFGNAIRKTKLNTFKKSTWKAVHYDDSVHEHCQALNRRKQRFQFDMSFGHKHYQLGKDIKEKAILIHFKIILNAANHGGIFVK
eukprot:435101_1